GISDLHVSRLYGARIEATLRRAFDGASVTGYPLEESSKTRYLWARISDDLLDRGFGRDTTLVAVGGVSSVCSSDSSRPRTSTARSRTQSISTASRPSPVNGQAMSAGRCRI